MAARRAIKQINWAALAERVPESQKNSFTAFKAKSDQYLKRVQEFPESAPKIDWEFYKKNVGVPGLVDKFRKEYESLQVPYPEDKYTKLIEAQEKEINAELAKFIDESKMRIEESLKEIKKLESIMKYGDMTMEDFKDAHPDLALDPLNRPTIFPHYPEMQPGVVNPKDKAI